MDFNWYATINSKASLNQGDLIFNCPLIIPPENFDSNETPEVEIITQNSIILSQSCDLVNGKITNVLVCPFYSLKSFIDELPESERNSKRAKKRIIENMKKGNLPGYHLLNKSETIEILDDYQVVDFRNVYSIHFESLKKISCKTIERIQLLPPYREQLSQAFARYFMRVGLP